MTDESSNAQPTEKTIERVSALIERVSETEILPRFQSLAGGAIRTKSGGELVTDADVAAEQALSAGLRTIVPDALIVGEEAASENPELVRSVGEVGDLWLIDPIDGTAHFARGEGPFGVMVALLTNGETVASWIYIPLSGVMATCIKGKGARLNGHRVRLMRHHDGAPKGALLTRFFPTPYKDQIERAGAELDLVGAERCAAIRYIRLLEGVEHFALYFRTHPWDHAAGALLVQEAGGLARRLDRSKYTPREPKDGLLIAANETLWDDLHTKLIHKDLLVDHLEG